MDNKFILTDSIHTIHQTIDVVAPFQNSTTFDNCCKIATIIIAIINVLFILYIFLENTKKDNNNNEKNRKINLLKTLILDYNMKYLYDFFDNIKKEADKLKENDLNNDNKNEINNQLLSYGKELRQKFTDPFLAVDPQLYNNIIASIDELLDNMTNNIFDEGINLTHTPKFDELITNKITKTKTKIINILFNYSGG